MPGRWSRPSLLRGLIGWVSLIASFVVLMISVVMFVRALELTSYGSSELRDSLIWMGASGALLATGIALLIWEYSIRHNIPH